MLSSNGTQATIEFFLNLIKAQSPAIAPSIFMTDRDQAQVNAIRSAFPECQCVFYCWWHVLQAIRTHFNTKEFPDLWSLIQDWVRTKDDNLFNAWWAQIQRNTKVPTSIAKYIVQEWLPQKQMWSAIGVFKVATYFIIIFYLMGFYCQITISDLIGVFKVAIYSYLLVYLL